MFSYIRSVLQARAMCAALAGAAGAAQPGAGLGKGKGGRGGDKERRRPEEDVSDGRAEGKGFCRARRGEEEGGRRGAFGASREELTSPAAAAAERSARGPGP